MKNNIIQETLNPLSEYLISMERDTVNGWFELNIGIPNKWVLFETEEIKTSIVSENNVGKLVKIKPTSEDIAVDDLYRFLGVIIDNNNKIAEKEKEFIAEMENVKNSLAEKEKRFYDELEEMKKNAFKITSKTKPDENNKNTDTDKIVVSRSKKKNNE